MKLNRKPRVVVKKKIGDIYKFKRKFELMEYKNISFDNTDFVFMMDKMKFNCSIHGTFEKSPHALLLSKYGCDECSLIGKAKSKTKTYDCFIRDAIKKHGDIYSYPTSNVDIFENRKSIITITCKKHGDFNKRAQKFLSGQGCFKCRFEEMINDGTLCGGYNNKLFNSNRDIANMKGYLYYLSINNGELFKIGITRTSISSRVRAIKSTSNGEVKQIIILYYRECTIEDAYCFEQDILKHFKDIRVYSSYSSELFSKDISNTELFKNIFK